jgi:hypothetical protein
MGKGPCARALARAKCLAPGHRPCAWRSPRRNGPKWDFAGAKCLLPLALPVPSASRPVIHAKNPIPGALRLNSQKGGAPRTTLPPRLDGPSKCLQYYRGVHGCFSWAAREYPPARPRLRSAWSCVWARRASGFAIAPLPIPRRKNLATSPPRAWYAPGVKRRGASPSQCRRPFRFLRARRSRPPLGPRRPARCPVRGAGAGAGPSGRATYRDRRVSCVGRARLDGPPAAMQPTVGLAAPSFAVRAPRASQYSPNGCLCWILRPERERHAADAPGPAPPAPRRARSGDEAAAARRPHGSRPARRPVPGPAPGCPRVLADAVDSSVARRPPAPRPPPRGRPRPPPHPPPPQAG